MEKAATWLVILGFCFLAGGVVLRTILMMRSSDATPVGSCILYGSALVRQYHTRFPASPLCLLARATLLTGLLSLVGGVAMEFTR